MPVLFARHYRTDEPLRVESAAGVITAVEPDARGAAGPVVAPALFDPQVNGALGVTFTDDALDEAGVRTVANAFAERGVGAFFPTLITSSFDTLAHGLRVLARCLEGDPALAARMPGLHLEGPHICPDDGPRGAHPRAHVRPPDWDEFRRLQDAAGGRVRHVTLAPEWPGAPDFIARVAASGVVVALGHTAAGIDRIRAAIDAGATFATHLGNGCAAHVPRHDNPFWPLLADDRVGVSVIADGFHVPAELLTVALRAKGPRNLVLTCDSSGLAGLPPGRYAMWGADLEVSPTGRVGVAGTPLLAGSGVFTGDCVRGMARLTGVPLADAIDMAGAWPRARFGVPAATLEAGRPAQFWLDEGRKALFATEDTEGAERDKGEG